jgi:hypothetical protein
VRPVGTLVAVTPDEALAATNDWRATPASIAQRRAQRSPGFGGWQPAGFGHAYRAEEPRTSLCGKNIEGWHRWSDRFLAGDFDRCPDCVRALESLAR